MKMLRSRPGFSLAETLVTMAIMGIIGVAVTQLMVSQSSFFNDQSSQMNARSVSRSATSMVIQELRMLEAAGGVVAAARDSITIRVPYRMGVVCQPTNGTATTASFLPVDSSMNAGAGLSGYAWRDTTTGAYTYQEASVTVTGGVATTCTGAPARITTLTSQGGAVLAIQPAAATAPVATPIFLFQRVTYKFKNSTSVPGSVGLFRRVVATNTEEELVAPFDTAAKFRFFDLNSTTAQAAVPSPLSNMRGVELVLTARSERPTKTGATTSQYTTAVWFKNRVN
jgi:prepilin-type N-terminal cleavage/methylation domain-containing protein